MPPCYEEYPIKYILINIASFFLIAGDNSCRYWITFFDTPAKLSTVIPITTQSKTFNELSKLLAIYERPKRCSNREYFDWFVYQPIYIPSKQTGWRANQPDR